jgi:hypothetical protein
MNICPISLKVQSSLGFAEIVFIMYIWSFTMKKNFFRHLETIGERIGVHLESSKIVDQRLCFKNEHFLLEKPKNQMACFWVFPNTNYESILLVNDMPYKSLFNPLFNAIFLETFYKFQANIDYLFKIVLPYLEALHSFEGRLVNF